MGAWIQILGEPSGEHEASWHNLAFLLEGPVRVFVAKSDDPLVIYLSEAQLRSRGLLA